MMFMTAAVGNELTPE